MTHIIVICGFVILAYMQPELFAHLVTVFIFYAMICIFFNWIFGGLRAYLPPMPQIKGKGYGKRAAKRVWHHAYERQAQKRGPAFGLWHVLLLITDNSRLLEVP